MTTPNTLTYPPELLPATWNSNKGVIAKMAGETGIGAALTRLKALHAKIDWSQVTAMGYGKLHNTGEVDEAEKKAKAYHSTNVVPYGAEARVVRDLAKTVGVKFAASKVIPKSSTATVLGIAKAAEAVSMACKSLDEEWKTFEAAREKLAKQIEGQKKLIGPSIEKLKKGLAACIKTPTKESWNTNATQQCRSVNNGVQLNPEWKARFGATWVKYDGVSFFTKLKDDDKLDEKGKKTQAAEIVKMCKEIQGHLTTLENHFK